MSKLVLKDINKIYPNGFHAIHNFNLEIEDGEFIVFVGPSGCGKSTTLRMIAGLEEISKGEFLIDGVLANALSPVERGIAMVFQSYALYPHLSVYDNLAFGLSLEGADADIIDEKVKNVARILGLTDYLDRKPKALSGGQRQRVAVGRAIIRKANIFLMDEPLSNLDAKQRVTMRREIAQIHQQTGATTIYVTHDQTEAMTLANRIVIMKDGYVMQVGTPEELYFKPNCVFVAGFIGEPPMNFLKGNASKGNISIDNSDLKITIDKTNYKAFDGDIIVGFRPEDVVLKDNGNCLKIHAKATLIEMLGDSTNIYIEFGNQTAIIKVDPHVAPVADSEFDVFVPYDKMYLFDSKNEKVLEGK